MPVYESETLSRTELEKKRKRNVCSECGEWLATYYDTEKKLAFIACHTVTHHEGIAKQSEYREKNIPTWRKEMAEQIGVEKTNQLIKYQGVTSLTRKQAMEIMETIWPDAPSGDKTAAAILCANYGLNPLANHIFLIKFHNTKKNKDEWARVWGIKAKRLVASRRGNYSYLDMTPRLMTEEEQIKVWGETDKANLCYLTHLKDMPTGAEAYGYGKWPRKDQPYGTDKGNSQANMASIRSESQALDRLRPAEMPMGFVTVDEQYIEGESRLVDVTTGEITEELTEKPSDEYLARAEAARLAPLVKAKVEGKQPEPKPTSDIPQSVSSPTAQESNSPVLTGEIIPTTLQELMTWASSKGKTYTPSWVSKQLGVKVPTEIKDIEKAYHELRAISGWN